MSNPEFRRQGGWLRALALVMISGLGLFLSILSPVERAVSRFSVNVVNNQLDVSLPLSDRTPDVLRLRFGLGELLPSHRVKIFVAVAQDVAWQTRTAGALVVALDANGLWLGAKNNWIRLGRLSAFRNYQLEVFGDRSASLSEVSRDGSPNQIARLRQGEVPIFELTGLHIRDKEFVNWKDVEVRTSPSEVPRPSNGMFLGYGIVILSALALSLSEWKNRNRFVKQIPRDQVWNIQSLLKETWWLWIATLSVIFIVPPSHSESWIVEDLRVMDWVYGVNLGQYIARPFGGLFYLLLSLWVKFVTPVWLLRLPVAILFVLSVASFTQTFLVDLAGKRLEFRSRIIASIVIAISVFGQGEWLRPEIPILSMWMLSLSIAAVYGRARYNNTRLVIVGLLVGLMVHHPLGIFMAVSTATFLICQLIRLNRLGNVAMRLNSLSSIVVAFSVAVATALFGQNLRSFRRSMTEFRASSIAHDMNFQLVERLRDLNNSTLLLSFSVSLCLIAIAEVAIRVLSQKTSISREYLGRLFPAIIVAAALLMPAGPWALYFVYLAPLTASLLAAGSVPRRVSSWNSLLSAASAIVALLFRAVNQPLAESTLIAILISGLIGLLALVVFRGLFPALISAFVLGSSLIATAPLLESVSPNTARALSEHCNRSPSRGLLFDLHRACLYTWATTDGSQWGDWVNEAISVSRASEGAYRPVSFSTQRILGYGDDCGFVNEILSKNPTAPHIDARSAHVAHAYVLLSPCVDPPKAGPNLEAVSGIIHGRSHDMNYYRRVLASILENQEPRAEMICLYKRGIISRWIQIDSVVRIDEPNCLVLAKPFTQLDPVSVEWSEYLQ